MKWSFPWFAKKSESEQIDAPRSAFSYSAGLSVNADSSMQVSAFHRGVIYISSQIAKLPWELKDSQNVIIKNGKIPTLLSLQPNPEMNAMAWRLAMVQNAIIFGNAYAEIERNTIGEPVALWPLPSDSVDPMRLPDGTFVYRIRQSPSNNIYLQPSEVFHLKNFHTKDGIIGQGIVSYASEVLGITLGADRFANNLFANGGLPSGTLETEARLSDEAFERLKKSWKESHGGRKTGGVAILEEGLKFKPVSYSPDIMQFLESRKFGVLEIARFLGIPPTKLFDITAATYSNQEQSNLEVATDTLDAWAKALEIEADTKLLYGRYAGRRTEIDLYAVFRGDMSTRASYFQKMMQSAAMTPNEIRVKEGMSPYDGGDRFFVATNNFTPSDRMDEIIDSQIEKNEGPETPEEEASDIESEDPEDIREVNAELAREALKFFKR